jgi:multidrug efflux pump subunit AcrA (membrane-fusion protein)
VPDDALAPGVDGSAVWRVAAGVAQQVPVRPGPSGGGWTRVTGGLREGDQIVVRGKEGLRAGAPVQVAPDR